MIFQNILNLMMLGGIALERVEYFINDKLLTISMNI